uniref:FtsK/SpoIIIE domain-containing protein n=1 Tax=Lactococcus sp. TaxID=44273 RepID=UPI003241DDCD
MPRRKRKIIIHESSIHISKKIKALIFMCLVLCFVCTFLYSFFHFIIFQFVSICSLFFVPALLIAYYRYKKSIKYLLQVFVERAQLITKDLDDNHITINAKFLYYKDSDCDIIEYVPRAVNKINIDDFPVRIIEVLEDLSKDPWILIDYSITRTSFIMKFSHQLEERLVIDSDSDLNSFLEKPKVIRISSRVTWDLEKAPTAAVLGGTGSGKSSFIKYVILCFLILHEQNQVFVIDGKSAFLYSTSSFNKDGHTTNTPEGAMLMLDEITKIMNDRYSQMNANPDDEDDITYCQKYKDKGSYLFVIDELLALMTLVQAEDKLKKSAERLGPQIMSKILNLVVKSRQVNIYCLLSGQTLSAEILSTAVRSNIGFRAILGSVSPTQSMEMFNIGVSSLPRPSEEPFSGYYWHNEMDTAMPFLQPYVAKGFRFKSALRKLSNRAA